MEVPAPVLAAAAGLVEMYGPQFELLGQTDGADVYMFCFPDDEVTGFPFVYLLKDGKAKEVTGFDALSIIGSFDDVE